MSETEAAAAAAAAAAVKKIERGHQMYRDGEHEEALGYYTEALAMAKTKPQMIALHSNRAACYLKLHDFKKAAEECTLVLELDQEHTGALMLRAQTLVTLKEYNSALFDVNRLMELNPSSDVYQNLQARLKTQLLLAPIPECEEESSMSELEDDEIEEGEAIALADKKTEDTTTTSNPEAPFSQIQSFEDVPNTHSRKGDALQDPDESSKPVIAFEDQKKSAPGIPESPASRAIPRPMADKKTEITGTICNPEAPVSQTQSYGGISKVDSEGWKAIPKPKGHSNLDYSRWDRVEDDSSEDEEDEDEESLPQYRFRVKTVGVRPVR